MIEKQIGKWIERYEENKYLNGSILISSKERILLHKGFGMANWGHLVPNTPSTKFRVGSLAKAFTALAIFQLHEKGALDIDDYIDKYLAKYSQGDRITIYHCLTNTSGIPNYTSFSDFWSTSMRLPSTLNQLIDSFSNLPLNFVPGTKFEYSNSGYALLTAIIEKVSGLSYTDYIREKICNPLGMYNTGCDDGITVVLNLASGYSYWEKPIHPAYTDLSFPLGAYGLYSTTEDLLLWDKALTSYQLLNKDLTEMMFTPYQDSYACGWRVSKISGRKCYHHLGDISGFFSDFLRFVDEQVTIIFLSNMDVTPVTHLTQDIANVIFENNILLPASATPIEFTDKEVIAGTYFIQRDRGTLEITIKQNELYLTVPKRYGVLYKFKLVPISHSPSRTILVTEMVNEQLIFHYSSPNQIDRVEYKDYNDNNYIAYKNCN